MDVIGVVRCSSDLSGSGFRSRLVDLEEIELDE